MSFATLDALPVSLRKEVLKRIKERARRVSEKCSKIANMTSGTRVGRSGDERFHKYKAKNDWAFGK